MWVGACSACLCGPTAVTPGTDAKQTTPFSSNQPNASNIVDAMTPLTPGVTQKATRVCPSSKASGSRPPRPHEPGQARRSSSPHRGGGRAPSARVPKSRALSLTFADNAFRTDVTLRQAEVWIFDCRAAMRNWTGSPCPPVTGVPVLGRLRARVRSLPFEW